MYILQYKNNDDIWGVCVNYNGYYMDFAGNVHIFKNKDEVNAAIADFDARVFRENFIITPISLSPDKGE